jgi:protein tyrosine/serine phosphatase
MPRLLSVLAGVLIMAIVVGGPWCYKVEYDRHFRGFHVVEEGVLYRSAQLDIDGLKHIVREYGIRTIVDLRIGDTEGDQEEEQWANLNWIKHVRIPPRAWWTADQQWPVPAELGLEEFRKVMEDHRNHPVLVHCFGGVHRTGMCCAIYRMDFQGWNKEDAIAEMRGLGYTILDQHSDVQAFLKRYEPQRRHFRGAP